MWLVLAQLARNGFFAPPDEARDLIHDFYAEAWPGIVERFDPAQGSFRPYLFAAFYRFARRRIASLQRWRSRLSDVQLLAQQAEPREAPPELLERQEQSRAFYAALSRLPHVERTVLEDALSERGQGERRLAAKHNMSRYRLRETLVDALGRLAAQISPDAAESTLDARVAAALWRDGRTVRDAAALLGVAAAEVQAARRRNVAQLWQAIHQHEPVPLEGAATMETDALQLFKEVLLSPGRADLLDRLKTQSASVMRALAEGDLEFSEAEQRRLLESARWPAEVYAALAGGDEQAAEAQTELSAAIAALHAKAEEEIGEAFSIAAETLPSEFTRWDLWFAGVPPVGEEYRRALAEQPSVRAAGRRAQELLRYGITPGLFVEAARGIELLSARLIRAALGPPEKYPRERKRSELVPLFQAVRQQRQTGDRPGLLIAADLKSAGQLAGAAVPHSLLLAEVRAAPQCPPEAAPGLLQWMVEAAHYKPFFFAGFQAQPAAAHVIRLVQEPTRHGEELAYRWGHSPEEALMYATAD